MTNRRILGFTWLALAVSLGMVLNSFTSWVWVDLMGRATQLAGASFITVPGALSAVLSGAAAWFTWKHEGINRYVTEVIAELRKVVWPGRDELRESTIVVIISVLVFAGVLGSFDFVWAKITNVILFGAG